jgi:chitin disaccharide deacetylase
MKPFVLCADDYGVAPGVSAAIRALLAARRLSATSCLVVSPHWKDEAPALRALGATADIGLHLALTQFKPLGAMPSLAPAGQLPGVGGLMLRAYSGRLDRAEIGQEIDRQLDAFEAAMGRPPDYVDGHHHAQQLPVVRDALLERYRTRLPKGTFVRVGAEPPGAILRRGVAPLRAGVIAAIGAGFGARVAAVGVSHNRRFSGVRSFTERTPYRDLFRRFI